MLGFNGKGPLRESPKTGRGFGKCNLGNNISGTKETIFSKNTNHRGLGKRFSNTKNK